MCTVIVRTDPLTLLGVRDEFAARPWEGPGEHWPRYPGVIGGRDLRAGGTWLAFDPATRRAAALLNGRGRPAPEAVRLSRGDLPLRAVAEGAPPKVDLLRYDPFHLLIADPAEVRLWSWDGERATETPLPAGVSVIVNDGMDRADPKAAALLPLFEGAADWRDPVAAEPDTDPRSLIDRKSVV